MWFVHEANASALPELRGDRDEVPFAAQALDDNPAQVLAAIQASLRNGGFSSTGEWVFRNTKRGCGAASRGRGVCRAQLHQQMGSCSSSGISSSFDAPSPQA